MQETPEQMRERMAQRVKELKEEKEKKRQEEVNNKLEKRFEQNADELRKVDQDLKALRLAYERNMQLVEKQSLLQNQYEGKCCPTQRKCCSQSSTDGTSARRKNKKNSNANKPKKK